MEVEYNSGEINDNNIMDIESTTNSVVKKVIKQRTFEDLFWAVFNNKYIRNYLFRTLQNMKFQGSEITSFYIGNRQQFNRIYKLSWMVKRKAWSLLKLKLDHCLDFPTESSYLEFYRERDVFAGDDLDGDESSRKQISKQIIPGSENDEYLQITSKGVSLLFKECKDMEIIRLLYTKKRDQMNIVGDILKCAVENQNDAAIKLFLEDDQFKGTVSTKSALEWSIEHNNHYMATYLFKYDTDVKVSTSMLFSAPRSDLITAFILENESLYEDVPKNTLISYKVFLETKSTELQLIMVQKELVCKDSLALLDLQNKISFKNKDFSYNPAIAAYIKLFFKPIEIFNSRYVFFIKQLVYDLLYSLSNIKEAIEKSRDIGYECCQKVVASICESTSLITKLKLYSSFDDLTYFFNLPEMKENLNQYVAFLNNSKLPSSTNSFSANQIKELLQVLKNVGSNLCSMFIGNIAPIVNITQDEAFTIAESLPKSCTNSYLILKSYYIKVANKGDVEGLKGILELKDKGYLNYSDIFQVDEMFTDCQGDDQVDIVSNFVATLCSSKVTIPTNVLLNSIRKKFQVSNIVKFVQICSLLPINPDLSKMMNNIILDYLKKPIQNTDSKDTVAQLIKYSSHHLPSAAIDELFTHYINNSDVEMLDILFESIPDFFKFQKHKVVSCNPDIINWFMKKNESKSFQRLDFSSLLDTLISNESPFAIIELVFNYLVSKEIYQLPPKKYKSDDGDYISYKAVKLSMETGYEQVFSLLFTNHKLFYWDQTLFSIDLTQDTFKDINNIITLFKNNNTNNKNKKIKKDNNNSSTNNNNNNSSTNNNNFTDELLDFEEDEVMDDILVAPAPLSIIPNHTETKVSGLENNNNNNDSGNNNISETDKFKYTFNSKSYLDDLGLLVGFGEVKDAINYLKSKPPGTTLPEKSVSKIIKYSSLELIIEYFTITNYQQLSQESIIEKIFKYGRNDVVESLFKTHYSALERSFKKCARYNNFHTVSLLLRLFKSKFGSNKSAHIVNLAHQLIKEAIMASDIIIFNILYFNFDYKLSLDSFIQDYSQSDAFNNNYKIVKQLLEDTKGSKK